MAKWLLAVYVFPGLDGCHRNYGVRVVGSRNYNGINVALLLQHHAVVGEDLGAGVGCNSLGGKGEIDVAKSDDVLANKITEIDGSHVAYTDASDVEPLVR